MKKLITHLMAASFLVVFHSPLLAEARDGLAKELENHTYSDPKKPVFANVTGKRIATGVEAKKLCVEQVVSTVRWVDEEQTILDDGYDCILETGPGKVLTGLWKSFYRKMKAQPMGTVEAVSALLG